MTCAMQTEKKERPAEVPLWLTPLVLLARLFARFRQHLAELKALRRTCRMPPAWEHYYSRLRLAEWAIRQFCEEGAQRLLSGEDLDLASLTCLSEPPDDFQPPLPRSALAMHRRIEDITRFYANPERYIRRHATRVRRADPSGSNPSNPKNPQPASAGLIESGSVEFFAPAASNPSPSHSGLAIRAPP